MGGLRSAPWALAAYAAVVVGAGAFYLSVGRDYWFRADDWAFLIGRDGGSIQGLLREQHDHWNTVPIVYYRVMWRVFGIRYGPYLAVVVALHLTAASLLRVAMRRVEVGPWVATTVASAVVLLGASGSDNIVWSFQVGFELSLVFGLAHLLLADHDGPLDRRDLLGAALGLLALMSSGVGVALVAAVGFATLLRRGWRVAAAHVVPLAAIFGVWYLALERRDYSDSGGPIEVARPGLHAAWLTSSPGRIWLVEWRLPPA